MSIVFLQLPDVKGEAESRPGRCLACKRECLQHWGGQTRLI